MSAFSKIGVTMAAGLMTAALAGPALADDVVPYGVPEDPGATAQAQADAATKRAAQLEAQGGWAYKSGAIDREHDAAARAQMEADRLRDEASGVTPPAPSSELAAAEDRLAQLRNTGGWTYKSGAVTRAEAEVRAQGGPTIATPTDQQPVPTISSPEQLLSPDIWQKPVDRKPPTSR